MDPRGPWRRGALVAAQRSGRRLGAAVPRQAPSDAPSSIACAAPWAMNGSIAWQASPSSVTRPADQRSSGARSNSAQTKVSRRAPRIVRTCGCQPSKAASASADLGSIRPRLPRPGVLLDQRDEVDELPAADEVVDEMPARAHPYLRRRLELEVAQPLGRHQPAVGDAAGEPRALGPEQGPAHRASGCRRRPPAASTSIRAPLSNRASTRSPRSARPVSR